MCGNIWERQKGLLSSYSPPQPPAAAAAPGGPGPRHRNHRNNRALRRAWRLGCICRRRAGPAGWGPRQRDDGEGEGGAAVSPAALWALASLRTVELLGRRARSHGPTALLGAGSRAVMSGGRPLGRHPTIGAVPVAGGGGGRRDRDFETQRMVTHRWPRTLRQTFAKAAD